MTTYIAGAIRYIQEVKTEKKRMRSEQWGKGKTILKVSSAFTEQKPEIVLDHLDQGIVVHLTTDTSIALNEHSLSVFTHEDVL